jgi:GH15 family glucan-1,4-alpha-glucosidase
LATTLKLNKGTPVNRLDEVYRSYQTRCIEHLVSRVEPSGYISASNEYKHYGAHWFRDSSFVAISLLEFAGSRGADREHKETALAAATRVIDRNVEEIDKLTGAIRRAVETALDNEDFFKLSNQIYSRFGKEGMFAEDTYQLEVRRSWLMQHDSLPLLLLSLEKKADSFGLAPNDREFLNRNARLFADYLGKIYLTECSNIWEIGSDMLHSYDVASVYAAFRAMEHMCRLGEIDSMEVNEVRERESGLFPGGPLGFLKKYFVKDGVLYSSKRRFEDHPAEEMGVDASAVYVFTDLQLRNGELGAGVEENTILKVERDLFGDRKMPWRYLGDRYFGGRPWVLLAEKFAAYYIEKGSTEKAIEIQNYVIEKFGERLPEQDNDFAQFPGGDLDGELARNGGKPIGELAWSYAEAVRALMKMLDSDGAAETSRLLFRQAVQIRG